MIGNPFKFSIIISVIEEWNIDEAFQNGILLFSVDGVIYPNEVLNTTLKREVPLLRESLQNICIDETLYNMPKEEAFAEIYKLTYPSDIEIPNDYRFCITPNLMADEGYFIFALSNGKQVRIMASKMKYIITESIHDFQNINISETFLDIDELNRLISEIELV